MDRTLFRKHEVGICVNAICLPFEEYMVCPEFGPPTLTTAAASIFLAQKSDTLPFPSEPYCPPIIIEIDISTSEIELLSCKFRQFVVI